MKIGFPALLGLLFVGLKLTGHITWSWLWVTAPFWAPLVLFLGVLGFIAALAMLGAVVNIK